MKKLAILFFGLFAFATSAQAITYDFVPATDINAPLSGYVDGALTVTAGSTQGGSEYHAYLDSPFPNAQGSGGLGVCQTAGTCGSDDNHQITEYVRMSFDVAVDGIYSLNILGDHTAVAADTILHYQFDNDATVYTKSIAGAFLLDVILASNSNVSSLDYWITRVNGGVADSGIYVASMSTVPVPAAVWLFGSAMLGLIGLGRKEKMEAVTA